MMTLPLWIFESETLKAMLDDAERVSNSQVNDQSARTECASVVAQIREELEGRNA